MAILDRSRLIGSYALTETKISRWGKILIDGTYYDVRCPSERLDKNVLVVVTGIGIYELIIEKVKNYTFVPQHAVLPFYQNLNKNLRNGGTGLSY